MGDALVGILVAQLQGEGDVVCDRAPRQQRGVLEDEGEAERVVSLHAQLAARGLIEAGHEAEEGGFAAAGRADDGDELAAANFQIEAVQGLDPGGEVLVESCGDD